MPQCRLRTPELERVRFHLAAEPPPSLQGGVSLGQGAQSLLPEVQPVRVQTKVRGREGTAQGHCPGCAGGSVPWQPVCEGACHLAAPEPGSRAAGHTQTGGGHSVSELRPHSVPEASELSGALAPGPGTEGAGQDQAEGTGEGPPWPDAEH